MALDIGDIDNVTGTMFSNRTTLAQAQAAVRSVCVIAKRMGASRAETMDVLGSLDLDELALSMLTRAAS